jgi:hypothetical protein
MNDMTQQVPDLTDPATVAQLMGDMAKGMAAMAVLGQVLSQGAFPAARVSVQAATEEAVPTVTHAATEGPDTVGEERYRDGRQVFDAMKAPRTQTDFERAFRAAGFGGSTRALCALFKRLSDEAVVAFGDPTLTTLVDIERYQAGQQVFGAMKTPRTQTAFIIAIRDAGVSLGDTAARDLFKRLSDEAVVAFGDPTLTTLPDLDRYRVGRHVWVDMKAPRSQNGFTLMMREAGLGADTHVMRDLFNRLANELGN